MSGKLACDGATDLWCSSQASPIQSLFSFKNIPHNIPGGHPGTHPGTVLGKGRDDKEPIHLHPHTVKALRSYLRISPVKHGPLFTSLSGKTRGQRLTTRGLRMTVKDAMEMNGIDKTVHGFRHYFATQFIKHYDGDLLAISKYTRYRSIDMLQAYNDEVLEHGDLPKYYEVFESVRLATDSATSPEVNLVK